MEPRTGMSFATFDGAKAFVDNYAARFGFTILLSNTNKSSDAQYLKASLICEKGGKYGGNKENHVTKKVCCPFRVNVRFHKASKDYVFSKVLLEHSHIMIPGMREFSAQDRKLTSDEHGRIFTSTSFVFDSI